MLKNKNQYLFSFWNLLLFFALSFSIFAQNNDWKDSVKLIYSQKTALAVANKMNRLFHSHFLDKIVEGKTDSARKILLPYIESTLKSNTNYTYYLIICGYLAVENMTIKNISQGFYYLKQTEKLLKHKDKINHYFYYFNKYSCFHLLKKNDSALYFVNKMLEVNNFLKNDSLNAEANARMGSLCYGNKLYAQCRKHFWKTIDYKKRNPKSKHNIITLINTIALTWKHEKKYDSARFYYEKALVFAKDYEDIAWIGILSGNIGDTYQAEKKYEKAIPYLLIDLEYSNKRIEKNMPVNNNAMNTMMGLLECYTALDDLKNAKIYFDSLSNNIYANKAAYHSFYLVSANYQAKVGNYQKAFDLYKKHIQVQDSLKDYEMIKKVNELNIQYAFDKQRQEIDNLSQDKNREIEKNRQQNYLIIAGIIILLWSVLFIFILMRSNYQKKKANKLLASQKEEITSQADLLKNINAKLVELDDLKQNLTNMIVHDLKNPLNALLNIKPDNLNDYHQRIQNYSKQMLDLVVNILDIQKFEDAKIVLDREKIDFNLLIQKANEQIDFLAKEKNIKIEIDNKELKNFVSLDVEIMVRVLVNLFTNAIRYSFQNKEIIVTISSKNEMLKCSIKDFGKGIPQDKLERVFEKFVQLEEKDKQKYRSTGLGLTYCKMAIEAHEGKIWVESKENEGAEFIFTLPILDNQILLQDNTLSKNINQNNEIIYQLFDENKLILLPFYEELNNLEVYYISELETLLSKIPFNKNENLEVWGRQLKNAIDNYNQDSYKALINQIKQ